MRRSINVTRRALLTGGAAVVGSAALARATSPALAGPLSAPETFGVGAHTTEQAGGTVRLAFNRPATFNPLFSTDGTEQGVERLLYGTLVKITHVLDPQPDLAESVDVTPDATTYTFHLRRGLMFSDGQPLTANDVLFTFHRALDPRTGSPWRGRLLVLDGASDYDGETVTSIPGLEALDDYTIQMTLTAPDSTWLVTLGDRAGFSILPAHALSDLPPDQLKEAPISFNPTPSAGTFVFDEWLPDQYLAIRRNDSYAGTRARLEQVYLTIVPQPATAISQLLNGEIDILTIGLADIETVQGNPNVTVHVTQSLGLTWLIPNATRPAFSDKRVRQAMMYALDREGIVREVLKGQAEVVNSPIFGPDWMGVPEGLNAYSFDPDMARSLLAEANWDSGQTITMPFLQGNQLDESLIAIFQQQLKDVGMNIELLAVDVPEYTSRLITGAADGKTGDFDLMMGNGGVFRQDPHILVKYLSTGSATPAGSNYTHYSNPRIDELFAQGCATTDIEQRRQIYTEMAQILNEEVPWIYLWSPTLAYGVNNRVQGFNPAGHPGRVVASADEWFIAE